MNQTFQEFLATQSAQIPVAGFILNLILAAILAFILRFIYVRYGNALSNRKSFAWNFILITGIYGQEVDSLIEISQQGEKENKCVRSFF